MPSTPTPVAETSFAIASGAWSTKLPVVGRRLFAVALAIFGVQQFLFGDFVPGRAPAWPNGLPGRLVWAYVTGVVFILAGTAILLRLRARAAAIVAGTLIAVWALLRHLPIIVADHSFGSAWTSCGKALVLSGGAFAVAGTFGGSSLVPAGEAGQTPALIHLGRVCLALFFILCGIQHFLWFKYVVLLVPAWIPAAGFWTVFAAVALIAGGVGLLIPRTARLAGALSGLMVFLWFLMLHIPRALAAAPAQSRNEWTAVAESLAVAGLAWVLSTNVGQQPEK